MKRIEACFSRLRENKKKALIAYLCIGDPSVEDSIELAVEAVSAGADALELGVPFSDPVADGPVIARASERAIRAGSSLRRTLQAAQTIRTRIGDTTPLILFGYLNPIFVFGAQSLVEEASRAGIDGLLVVDLPPEEGFDLRQAAAANHVDMMPLLAPTSTPDRVQAALQSASGFLYYVSVTGITGASNAPLSDAAKAAEGLRTQSGLPVVIGFGIDSAEKAKAAAGPAHGGADGIVVGTALVKAIETAATLPERRKAVRGLISTLRQALDTGHNLQHT